MISFNVQPDNSKIRKGRDWNMWIDVEREIKNPAASYFPMTLAIIVSSALKGLTSVFGMGTGVSPSVSPPETYA